VFNNFFDETGHNFFDYFLFEKLLVTPLSLEEVLTAPMAVFIVARQRPRNRQLYGSRC
jgi:hypothetical protein